MAARPTDDNPVSTDLPTLRRILAEATPLPWMAYGRSVVNDQYDDVIATKTEGAPWMEREVLVLSDADREAIVALINAAPALLQAAEERDYAAACLKAALESQERLAAEVLAMRAERDALAKGVRVWRDAEDACDGPDKRGLAGDAYDLAMKRWDDARQALRALVGGG